MIQSANILLDRMVQAVEDVRQRLLRATAALKAAGIPYAVAGGNAVAVWVATIDKAAVRNTQDVDILVRRGDFDRVKATLVSAGFVYRHVKGLDAFLDPPALNIREAVHILFANERVRPADVAALPDVDSRFSTDLFDVLALEKLVQAKLVSFRDKDRTHLRDLVEVGLIDSSWPGRFPSELAQRLQHILDTPEG
jgi:hypothetical protein